MFCHTYIAGLSSLILAMKLSEYFTSFAVPESQVWNVEGAITYMFNNNNNNNNKTKVKATKPRMQRNIEVKQRRAWTREEIREVVWCYMYCRRHFTACPILAKEQYTKRHDRVCEIIPTRCNNCVYSSQWLYSTCFG